MKKIFTGAALSAALILAALPAKASTGIPALIRSLGLLTS
jgi:hypothetical protein